MFFRLTTLELAIVLAVIILGTTGACIVLGRYFGHKSAHLREPLGVLQAALLGLVGLILAFGLALALGRHESRRTALVDEANAIGTTYLRAQTLAEPQRTKSLRLLVAYTDTSLRLAEAIPKSGGFDAAVVDGQRLQRQLWTLAGQALDRQPVASAPRLYVESLNEMIDLQTVRVSGLGNRVPTEVLVAEIVGAVLALGLLAFYLALLGRGVLTVLLAGGFITLLLLVTFDLDRPTRGLITVPTAPLVGLRTSMALPPAALPPRAP